MKKLLIICFLFIFSLSFAQNTWRSGSVYFKDGTVKTGLVIIPRHAKWVSAFSGKGKVRFKKGKKAKRMKFGPDVVEKVILSDNSTFVYLQTKNKFSLYEELIGEGPTKLYSRKVVKPGVGYFYFGDGRRIYSYLKIYIEYYLQFPSQEKVIPYIGNRGNRYFIKKSIELFQDCETLVADLNNELYTRYDLFEVVDKYNECDFRH